MCWACAGHVLVMCWSIISTAVAAQGAQFTKRPPFPTAQVARVSFLGFQVGITRTFKSGRSDTAELQEPPNFLNRQSGPSARITERPVHHCGTYMGPWS